MPRPRTLISLSTSALAAELRRRQRVLPGLERKRDGIAAKVAALDAEIASLGGTPNGALPRRGGGPPRAGTVVAFLLSALKGRTMKVTEAAAAVKKAGYKSQASTRGFYSAVAFALAQSGRFRRVGRGRYRAR